jgi:hypothetical protein
VKNLTPTKSLFLFVLVGLWFSYLNHDVMAQQAPLAQCSSGHAPPVNYRGWPQGITVNVYIDPAIIGPRRSSVETAFNNWTQSRGSNGSNNSYYFVTQPPPAGTGFTVLNQTPPSGDRAQTLTSTNNNTGNTMYAITYLIPTMTNPDAVLEAMSHEIGHPLGLGHLPGLRSL